MCKDSSRHHRLFQIIIRGQDRRHLPPRQQRFSQCPHLLFGRPAPRADRRFDCVGGLAHPERLDQRPAPCAFLPRLIQNDIYHRFPGLAVDRPQGCGTDVYQIGTQRTFSPAFQQSADLRGTLSARITQKPVNLCNHLHICVFNAVVHGLDEMPGTVGAQMRDTGRAFVPGCDGLCHRAQLMPGVGAAAHHHRRACPRAFLAAGHAHTDKVYPGSVKRPDPPARCMKIRISAINQGVPGVEMRRDRRDHRIHRRPGRDHEQDTARTRD